MDVNNVNENVNNNDNVNKDDNSNNNVNVNVNDNDNDNVNNVNAIGTSGRGRPRQPYCPDCLKIDRKVRKQSGNGYCREHQNLRVRSYKRANRDDIPVPEAREKELQEELDRARGESEHYRLVLKEHEATIANLIASIEAEGAGLGARGDEDRYLHPDGPDAHDRDRPRGLEEDYKALVGTYKQFRDWAKKHLDETGVEPPFYVKAYLDVKFDDEVEDGQMNG